MFQLNLKQLVQSDFKNSFTNENFRFICNFFTGYVYRNNEVNLYIFDVKVARKKKSLTFKH